MSHYGPGFSYYSPEFPGGDVITIADGVVATLKPRKQKKWRAALAHALDMWRPAGIVPYVSEVNPLVVVGIGEPDWPGSSSEMTQHSVAGRITLVRSTYTPELPKWWPFAWSYAYASYYNVPRLLRQPDVPTNALDRVLCHEIGHNLGLAHGGNGIMSGGTEPNLHDLDAVRAYYS